MQADDQSSRNVFAGGAGAQDEDMQEDVFGRGSSSED